MQLAVLPHAGDWRAGALLSAAELYRHPLHATLGTGPLDAPPASHFGLSVDGAALSSVRRREGALEVRLVAQSPEAATAVVRGSFTSARRVDLLGRPGETVPVTDGELRLTLRPWEIATLRLA
ncbi:hypothetical protein QRX50_33415 [Amycolatopsis carbonis]|uniref:Glycosyl hydrolases family 38 C-terminal domain-containing protein n=1 Tax=Amycolatopsis carbonis TaxID=715471 RepID=A0A9Y2IC93_9PSEU|nr:glycosyl hydrolase-related protein [Amycolatopsis sp. 2-15]WIX76341.1 hypothetical protein QRX50_33415 [Amycolatopsis sp. 2-15]